MFGNRRGYSYCFNYVIGSGHFRGGWDEYLFNKGGMAFNMGKGNINDMVDYTDVFEIFDGKKSGGVGGTIQALTGGSENSVFGSHIFWGNRSVEKTKIIGW